MPPAEQLFCPVCKARFRESRICSRCGADLSPLMEIAAQAFAAYQNGVLALANGHFAKASQLAEKAALLHNTAATHNLTLLTKWLIDHCGTLHNFP
jgi:hypothetical protein